MKLSNISKNLKRLALGAVAGLILAAPVSAMAAWGPDRPTFDYNGSSNIGSMSGPVFNSFTNAPQYGDERNFVTVSKAGEAAWTESVAVTPGQEYEVRAYVHNNANESTNGANMEGAGVAHNTRVRFYIPTGQANGFDIGGYVSADNAKPGRVYDTGTLKNDSQAFSLSYVPGSAKLYNNGAFKNGTAVSDEVVGANGALVGWDKMDGNFPGCFDYKAVVIIKVKVNVPKLEFKKQVMTASTQDKGWQASVSAKKGDTISWLLTWLNNGSDQVNDINIRDSLPAGLTLVPGSVTWFDTNYPDGKVLADDSLKGVNIGNYGVNGGGYIRFKTVINKDTDECEITNKAFVVATNVPEQSTEAKVTISDCKPAEVSYKCELLTVEVLGNRKVRATVKPNMSQGVTVKSYKFEFGDGTDAVVTDKTQAEHTYAKDGTYNITAKVTFLVNGQSKEVTSDACTKKVDITTAKVAGATTGKLPDTGAGSVVGIFLATTVAAAFGHRQFMKRRFGRSF